MIKGSKASGGKKPTTPTIGSATAGNTTATVAFTASTYLGKDGTATYRAVSNPGSLTGTSSSSPITVSGLTNGTAYTFTVRAEAPYGVNSDYSSASNSVTPSNNPPIPPVFSDYWFGYLTSSYDLTNTTNTQIGVDQDGNSYYSGFYASNATPDYVPYITKIDSAGDLVWQKTLNNITGINATAIDSTGNVYAIGVSPRPAFTINDSKITLLKYNSSGVLQWQKDLTVPSTGEDSGITEGTGFSIAFDSNGFIYVVGNYRQTYTSHFDVYAFIVKYNSSGSVVWQKSLLDPTGQVAGYYECGTYFSDITIDESNNIYVAGFTRDYAITGSTYDNLNAIIAKYNTSGTLVWYKRFASPISAAYGGDDSYTYARFSSIDTDSAGNIYAIGTFGEDLSGTYDDYPWTGVVMKFNSFGTVLWKKAIGAVVSGAQVESWLQSIVIDDSDNVFAAGYYEDSDPFFRGFVSCLNTSGSIQWQNYVKDNTGSGTNGVTIYAVNLDAGGNVFFSGYWDPTSVTATVLTGHVPSNGSSTGTYTVDGTSFTYNSSSLTSYTKTATPVSLDTLSDEFSTLTEGTATLTSSTAALTSGKTTL